MGLAIFQTRIDASTTTQDHATMKPTHSILDDSFRYVPAVATSVAETWRRFGWRPTTEEERKRRRRPTMVLVVEAVSAVTTISQAVPKIVQG